MICLRVPGLIAYRNIALRVVADACKRVGHNDEPVENAKRVESDERHVPEPGIRELPLVGAHHLEGPIYAAAVGEAVGEAARPAVRSALQASLAALTACYREALSRSPGLDGSLVVEVALSGKAGPPRSARIAADSVHDEPLAACVQEVAAKARFPAGRAGTASMAVQLELAPGG